MKTSNFLDQDVIHTIFSSVQQKAFGQLNESVVTTSPGTEVAAALSAQILLQAAFRRLPRPLGPLDEAIYAQALTMIRRKAANAIKQIPGFLEALRVSDLIQNYAYVEELQSWHLDYILRTGGIEDDKVKMARVSYEEWAKQFVQSMVNGDSAILDQADNWRPESSNQELDLNSPTEPPSPPKRERKKRFR